MASPTVEDNIKNVIGNIMLQNIQLQTLATQLQEQLAEAQAAKSVAEEAPKLKAVPKKE